MKLHRTNRSPSQVAKLIACTFGLVVLSAGVAVADGMCDYKTGAGGSIIDVQPGRCAPFAEAFIEGTGQGIFLGDFIMVQSHCFDPFDPAPFFDGQFTYTSVTNPGDSFIGTYGGVSLPSPTSEEDGVWFTRGDAHFEIVGGTGRLAGATGGGTPDGVINFNTFNFTITLTGKVKVPLLDKCGPTD